VLHPRTRLGRYELLLLISSGGMGEVWAARLLGEKGFTKLVAVKTMLPRLVGDPSYERMFLREANLASLVAHPNICGVYDLGEEHGVLYMAMQWVEGGSLYELLNAGGPLIPRVSARIISDTCAGLHAAHELTDVTGRPLDAVHLDVSPENILVSVAGGVKLTDFGIARLLTDPTTISLAGRSIRGKAAYMAPEQAAGEPVDRRSDVFSMGCVLYEATIGAPPFTGGTLLDVIRAVLRGQVDPPSKLMPKYPPALEAVVLRALASNPRDRFGTARDMHEALEQWLATEPIVTHSELGSLVRRRIGNRIDALRARIRTAQK
jgi:serine/threonine protein kinase